MATKLSRRRSPELEPQKFSEFTLTTISSVKECCRAVNFSRSTLPHAERRGLRVKISGQAGGISWINFSLRDRRIHHLKQFVSTNEIQSRKLVANKVE